MYVIMSEDRKCIVKGRSRKHLCGFNEPTRKELVGYDTMQKARSALMRMYLLKSDYAGSLYVDKMPRLEIVEMDMEW